MQYAYKLKKLPETQTIVTLFVLLKYVSSLQCTGAKVIYYNRCQQRLLIKEFVCVCSFEMAAHSFSLFRPSNTHLSEANPF